MSKFNPKFIEPWKGPWHYPVRCESCYNTCTNTNIPYIPDLAWISGEWFCSNCGKKYEFF